MQYSSIETDVLYAVGSTIVDIKLIANTNKVGWRTTINTANLCDSEGMLTLDSTGSILIVSAHGKNYFMHMCGYHE